MNKLYEIVYENPNSPSDYYGHRVRGFPALIKELKHPTSKWSKQFGNPIHVDEINEDGDDIRSWIWGFDTNWDLTRLTPTERRHVEEQ